MRLFFFIISSLFLFSCIPYRISPSIETYRIMNNRRFLKKVPKSKSFVFIDPKEADEFHRFITIKLTPTRPWESPLPYWETQQFLFTIERDSFYLTYYEAYKVTKTINLLPIFIDKSLNKKQIDPLLEDHYSSSRDHWYIILTVRDANEKDALNTKHPFRAKVIAYLEAIRREYLSTHNYTDQLFKKEY